METSQSLLSLLPAPKTALTMPFEYRRSAVEYTLETFGISQHCGLPAHIMLAIFDYACGVGAHHTAESRGTVLRIMLVSRLFYTIAQFTHARSRLKCECFPCYSTVYVRCAVIDLVRWISQWPCTFYAGVSTGRHCKLEARIAYREADCPMRTNSYAFMNQRGNWVRNSACYASRHKVATVDMPHPVIAFRQRLISINRYYKLLKPAPQIGYNWHRDMPNVSGFNSECKWAMGACPIEY